MSKIIFNCPHCEFNKELWRKEIPSKAKYCTCPKCKTKSLLAESIKPIECREGQESSPQEDIAVQLNHVEKTEDDSKEKYQKLFEEAISAIRNKKDIEALLLLEEAEKLYDTPIVRSYLAYCRAKVNQEFADAIRVCKQSIKEQATVVDHYLNLGRIYMHINKRGLALQVFRKGIKLENNTELMQELRKFEKRKTPVIPSLSRDHMLNRQLGKVLGSLRLR